MAELIALQRPGTSLMPGLAAVLRVVLPHSRSVFFNPMLTRSGETTLLRWALDRIQRTANGARTALLLENGTAEELVPHLGTGVSGASRDVSVHVIDHRAAVRVHADIAHQLHVDRVVCFDAGFCFAPPDLMARLERHHLAIENNFTCVAGLPDGAGAQLYETSLLDQLAGLNLPFLPSQPLAMIEALAKASQDTGQRPPFPLKGRAFSALVSYGVEVADLPETVRIRDAEEVSIAERVIAAMAADAASVDPIAPLRLWKRFDIERQRHRRQRVRATTQVRESSGPRRVLFVAGAAAFSGGEESLCHLVAGLDRSRFEPHALVSLGGVFAQRLEAAGLQVTVPDLPFTACDVGSIGFVAEHVDRVAPDVMHLQSPAGLPAVLAGLRRGIPLIAHVRTASPLGIEEEIRHADAVVAVSEFVRRQLCRLSVEPQRVQAIVNGIDTDRFRPHVFDKTAARLALGLAPDGQVVVSIARITPAKRQDLAIEAVRRLRTLRPDIRLVLVGEVGDGDSGYVERLRRQIASTGMSDAVTFVGFQTDIRIVECAADALLLCSEREPMGRCVLEGMAMGLPLVVTDGGGNPEIVRHGATGWVASNGNPEHIAACIDEALGPAGPTRGAAAREFAVASLSVATHASRVMALYDTLLGRPTAQAAGRAG